VDIGATWRLSALAKLLLLLGRIAVVLPHIMEYGATIDVDAAYCYSQCALSACRCRPIGLSARHDRDPAKTAKQIELAFGVCTRVSQRNQVLDAESDTPRARVIYFAILAVLPVLFSVLPGYCNTFSK